MATLRALGIDPGTSSLGLAIAEPGQALHTEVWRWSAFENPQEHMVALGGRLVSIAQCWNPTLIVIERFRPEKHTPEQNTWMQQLIGQCLMLRHFCSPDPAEIMLLPAHKWRRILLPRVRGCTKESVHAFLTSAYPGWYSTEHGQHDVDALGMATAALWQIRDHAERDRADARISRGD